MDCISLASKLKLAMLGSKSFAWQPSWPGLLFTNMSVLGKGRVNHAQLIHHLELMPLCLQLPKVCKEAFYKTRTLFREA